MHNTMLVPEPMHLVNHIPETELTYMAPRRRVLRRVIILVHPEVSIYAWRDEETGVTYKPYKDPKPSDDE